MTTFYTYLERTPGPPVVALASLALALIGPRPDSRLVALPAGYGNVTPASALGAAANGARLRRSPGCTRDALDALVPGRVGGLLRLAAKPTASIRDCQTQKAGT